MYIVSEKFKQSVYAPSRMIRGRVTFDISDTSISSDTITTSVSSEFELSNKAELTDKIRENSYNLATWETDRFKLDGSFTFPDDTLVNNKNVGWCSNQLCDGNGFFSDFPTISFVFGKVHSSAGITITFEQLQHEYASDFDVMAYDQNDEIIWTTSITDNTLELVQVNGQFLNYKRLDIVIKKWNVPYRRARMAEVDFGIIKVYTDNNLIKMGLIEEVDLLSSTVPSPEFKFTVDNSERLFNILNPTGFYKYLQQQQVVFAELGVDNGATVEYIPLGNYLLWDWTSDEGSLTATFTARTNLDLMSNHEFENVSPKSNFNLYQLAIELFAMCDIKNYSIDEALKDIQTLGLMEKTDCKTALQMVAIASCANIFVTRDNKICLKVSPLNIGEASDTIDMDNMYSESQIALQKIVKDVVVTQFVDLQTKSEISVTSPQVLSGDLLKLENNTLINSDAHATNVANWILRQSNNRSLYSVNWRGNPSHELMDVIMIENSYGANMGAFITKNELNYEGYLTGKTEAKGVAN